MNRWRLVLVITAAACLLFISAQSTLGQSLSTDFAVKSGNVKLAARLICPSTKKGPFPCVVFTHGSEAGVRSNYQSFVDRFVERGYAVVVYDKRGCGESTGTYVEAPDLDVPANDLIACVESASNNELVDASRMGVWGVSQGGWVGPLAASKSQLVSFVIMVSGPSISPLEQNLFDKGNQLEGNGYTKEEIARVTDLRRLVWTYLTYDKGKSAAQKAWDEAKTKKWFRAFKNQVPMGDRDRLLKHPRLIHFAAHSKYDPEPALTSVNVPVLAIYGDADTIVPADRCAKILRSFFAGDRSSLLTVKRFADADHGIRVRRPSGKREFASGYWQTVLDWLDETCTELKPADKTTRFSKR